MVEKLNEKRLDAIHNRNRQTELKNISINTLKCIISIKYSKDQVEKIVEVYEPYYLQIS